MRKIETEKLTNTLREEMSYAQIQAHLEALAQDAGWFADAVRKHHADERDNDERVPNGLA